MFWLAGTAIVAPVKQDCCSQHMTIWQENHELKATEDKPGRSKPSCTYQDTISEEHLQNEIGPRHKAVTPNVLRVPKEPNVFLTTFFPHFLLHPWVAKVSLKSASYPVSTHFVHTYLSHILGPVMAPPVSSTHSLWNSGSPALKDDVYVVLVLIFLLIGPIILVNVLLRHLRKIMLRNLCNDCVFRQI